MYIFLFFASLHPRLLVFFFFTIFFSCFYGLAAAEDRFAPDTRLFTLKNGMSVVVIPDHRVPVVTHMIWYKLGSTDEPMGKSGIAHFLEHLLFKGTDSNPGDVFSQFISKHGGYHNAFTSFDFTAYYQRVPKKHLPRLMELEADRMVNLSLSKEQVAVERNVVLEERRQMIENNPHARLQEEMNAVLYRVHPYGRPVIGWKHEINALNYEDAFNIYKRFYRPDNAVLLVMGDVEFDEVYELAQLHYGKLARRDTNVPRVRRFLVEPPQRSLRKVKILDKNVSQPIFRRQYDVPSYVTKGWKTGVSLDVLANILMARPMGRLHKGLVLDRKIASKVHVSYHGTRIESGVFVIEVLLNEGAIFSDIEEEIEHQFARLAKEGVTENEMRFARNQALAMVVYLQDDPSALANFFAEALMTGLTLQGVQAWPRHIVELKASDVRDAVSFLRPESSVTGFLLSSKIDSEMLKIKKNRSAEDWRDDRQKKDGQ
ncbi:MAG: pitrilysin family protein [Alphaproteobacteria bacterium]|nr:pitrilysin family protein [Alphaproteobacteria bacterium]